jgi:hypothetical protein
MRTFTEIFEAAYKGNIGFEEMIKFYQVASEREIQELEDLVDDNKAKQAWDLVEKVTGMKLKR